MVELNLTPADLTQVRFAFSPLWELIASVRVLRAPDRYALHLPWARRARENVGSEHLAHLFALVPPHGYVPNFLTRPPVTPFADLHEELRGVRNTPPEQVRADIGEALIRPLSQSQRQLLSSYLDDPEEALVWLTATLEHYWQAALTPHWPRIRRVLETDVETRARELALGGFEALFREMHPHVTFEDQTLRVALPHWSWWGEANGRGLRLLPSVFAWPDVSVLVEEPWRPTLAYPARGAATLWWDEGTVATDPARALLGQKGASLVALLRAPINTIDLARALQLTPSAVSQRLRELRKGGLIVTRREGRFAWHSLSPSGQALAAVLWPSDAQISQPDR